LCAAFSPDGKSIISGSQDGTVRIWDAQTGDPALKPLSTKRDSCPFSVAFSSNGGRIAAGCYEGFKIWDAETGKEVITSIDVLRSNYSIVFSPNEKTIASCSARSIVQIWDAQTGNRLRGPLDGHSNPILALTFSIDGTKIASGSDDGTVRVWDANSGQLVQGPFRHDDGVYFVAFSPDGTKIISGIPNMGVCVWDTTSGALLAGPSYQHTEGTLTAVVLPMNGYYCLIAVSPNGKWIASHSMKNNNLVHVWDSRTGQVARSIDAHTEYVCSVAFSPDSKRIVTTSVDKTVHVHTIHQY
jgi:WD40 repeat protein